MMRPFKNDEDLKRYNGIMTVIADFEKKLPGKEDEIFNAVIRCLVENSTIGIKEVQEEVTSTISWIEDMKKKDRNNAGN